MDWIPWERRKKRTSKKNVDGRSTSSHDNKKFRTRSMEKQSGMAFGFRKTATTGRAGRQAQAGRHRQKDKQTQKDRQNDRTERQTQRRTDGQIDR